MEENQAKKEILELSKELKILGNSKNLIANREKIDEVIDKLQSLHYNLVKA